MKSIIMPKSFFVLVCVAASVVAALPASARTVYDAGKAFHDAGANANTFGVWSLLHAKDTSLSQTAAFGTYAANSGVYKGISGQSNGASPWVRVNTSSETQYSDGEAILPDELYLHPANPTSTSPLPFDLVRFTAPEAGWYSACIFAHDVSKNVSSGVSMDLAGVQVTVRARGNIVVRQIVSLEDYADNSPTRRFDFQLPVMRLSAGETIEVVIGNKSATASGHTSDATGLRFSVTKEDEGAFYDSGIAMTNCVADSATYTNPYGTVKDGTWYFLRTTVPSSDVDFKTWAPGNFSHGSASRIATQGTRTGGLKGFGNNTSGQSPYVVVNPATSVSSDNTAPNELQAHPNGNNVLGWTTIRFRPSASGYYSASVVARHLNNGTDSYDYTGVDVYLLVSERVVTNAYIFTKAFSSTARLTFDSRLLVAGEPVDIVVSPHGEAHADATAVSVILRREEGDLYDAGNAYYEEHVERRCSNYFGDPLDVNAKWLVAARSDPWSGSFTPLGSYLEPSGTAIPWWVHATGSANNGTAPRFTMAANGMASVDSTYTANALLLAVTPREFVVQPNNANVQERHASLKAEVPSNGIYRVRSYVRDINNNSEGDGVLATLVANGYAPASAIVSRDSADGLYETVLSADRLWLKQGEYLAFTVDPRTGSTSDATGLTACYERTGDATARVINVDFSGTGSGRLSAVVERGREGWSDWNRWNALRPGNAASASIYNCREADGETRRNVSVALTRGSGNIASVAGSSANPLLNGYVSSSGAADAYTFTIAKLKKNEPYTLYLYSAQGGAAGNASFTVGGEAKGLEEPWSLGATNMVTRFEVTSDVNGEITGVFAAADANGGAFNGLTIVGEFPDYVAPGMVLFVR